MVVDKKYHNLVAEGEWLLTHQIHSGSSLLYNLVDKERYNTWAMNCISFLDPVAERHAQRINQVYSPEHPTVNIVEQILGIVKSAIAYLETQDQSQSQNQSHKVSPALSNRIFIVHGRDEEMEQSVARMIEKLGLTPIILHERPNQGRTIIEKFSDYSEVSFSIVLLSPDDMGYLRTNPPESAKPRARQNVIFELGFFLGRLGREKVLSLFRCEKDFDLPSDYSGVLFIPYDSDGKWQFNVVRELKACGYKVDANILLAS